MANNPEQYDSKNFDREMFRVRKLVEAEAELSPHLKDLYVCSLSNQTITYKGQLTPEQLYGYYKDLQVPHLVPVAGGLTDSTYCPKAGKELSSTRVLT